MNKIQEIYNLLLKEFGKQGWWPLNNKYFHGNYSYPLNEKEILEICIGAILTQSISWKNVEKALNELRKSNLIDLENLRKIDFKELADIIKSSGYNNQNSKKIKGFVEFLKSGKEISRENLLEIWGVGIIL